jgi:F-type H+-transporting ATPase subunit b
MIGLNFRIALALASSIPEGRMIGMDAQQILQVGVQLVNLIALAVILTWILYKPVRKFMGNRTNSIMSQILHAGEEMVKANELKLMYEEKINEIERERDSILDNARKLANETGQHILAEAKNEADAIRARANANIELEMKRVESDMKHAIIDASAAIATKLIVLNINKDVQEKLYDETMAELEGVTWQS